MLCACAGAIAPVSADTILLRNGSRIDGDLIGQSRTSVRLRVQGRIRDIPKDSIRRITYGLSDQEKARRQAAHRELLAKKARLALMRKRAEELAKQDSAAAKKKREQERIRHLEAEVNREEERTRRERAERKALVVRLKAEAATREKQILARERELENERDRLQRERESLRKVRAQIQKTEAKQAEERRRARGGAFFQRDALFRSAAVPGWGQWHQGRRWRGVGFASASVLLLGAVMRYDANYNTARERYDRSVLQYSGFVGTQFGLTTSASLAVSLYGLGRQQAEQRALSAAAQRAQVLSWGLAVLYLYNLFDAAWAPAPDRTGTDRAAVRAEVPRRFFVTGGREVGGRISGNVMSAGSRTIQAGMQWTF